MGELSYRSCTKGPVLFLLLGFGGLCLLTLAIVGTVYGAVCISQKERMDNPQMCYRLYSDEGAVLLLLSGIFSWLILILGPILFCMCRD